MPGRLVPTLGNDDVDRMTARLYLRAGPDRAARTSAFWVLLLLAAVIAGAGVVADSTATVIGAMIVAPLMTPILGTALAVVLADRRQVLGNLALVVAGAAAVVAVGWLLGLLDPTPVLAEVNGQVAGRVRPRIVDLLGALATGAVGAFALVRSDVSDALPGVAIAISLVPPLVVVGLTLEAGSGTQAFGALLLFLTNVAAIVATGTLVMLVAGVRRAARAGGLEVGRLRGRTVAVVVGSVVVVAVPLSITSVAAMLTARAEQTAVGLVEEWAGAEDWGVQQFAFADGTVTAVVVGPEPAPEVEDLRAALDDAGLGRFDLEVTVVPGRTERLAADR